MNITKLEEIFDIRRWREILA